MSALIETGGKPDHASAAVQAAGQTQYLTFMLGGEMFAVGILAVKEIIEYGNLTEVTMMSECIRGVINLSPAKKALGSGRLAKRLQHCRVDSYDEYFRLLEGGQAPDEVQMAVDLLTTNETYFFREAKHFDLLREYACAARSPTRPVRVGSAASSSGEEAYSIVMVLADCLEGAPRGAPRRWTGATGKRRCY